jgi:hypothetical protein
MGNVAQELESPTTANTVGQIPCNFGSAYLTENSAMTISSHIESRGPAELAVSAELREGLADDSCIQVCAAYNERTDATLHIISQR